MKNKNIYNICLAGVFAAVIFVATAFLKIPLFAGYANFGDCFIILAGVILGPAYGALASGIGAGIADLFAGYGIYAPATFVIKGLMALAVYGIYMLLRKNRLSIFVCGIAAEAIMILGYFVFEFFLYGSGTAFADIFGNSMQGAVGLVSSSAVYLILDSTHVLGKLKTPTLK